MTKKIISVSENDSLHTTVNKLAKNDISSLPVIRGPKLVGLVTEGDVVRTIDAYSPRIHYDTASSFSFVLAVLKRKPFDVIRKEILGSEKIKVRDFMNRTPRTVCADCDIYDAARLMNRHNVKMLPVVGKNKKLLGVIARADIIRALAK